MLLCHIRIFRVMRGGGPGPAHPRQLTIENPDPHRISPIQRYSRPSMSISDARPIFRIGSRKTVSSSSLLPVKFEQIPLFYPRGRLGFQRLPVLPTWTRHPSVYKRAKINFKFSETKCCCTSAVSHIQHRDRGAPEANLKCFVLEI